jgi:hypothetical protein
MSHQLQCQPQDNAHPKPPDISHQVRQPEDWRICETFHFPHH